MTPLREAVAAVEAAAADMAKRNTLAHQLALTTALLALRRAAGLPARLCGPAGRLAPRRLAVVGNDGPDAA